jgi:hypothetical protein
LAEILEKAFSQSGEEAGGRAGGRPAGGGVSAMIIMPHCWLPAASSPPQAP